MHAEELRRAVKKIVSILNEADIQAVIRQYRAAKGEQRTIAAARLNHAGARIMEHMAGLSGAEASVIKAMHLETLSSARYWQGLLGENADPKHTAAELVHLYSRVMFASSHLPHLAGLLDSVQATPASGAGGYPLKAGEGRLVVRLADAGEKAADPDRVARAIDGIDMLYSACASIARKPAMDLRLDGIDSGGGLSDQRDIHVTGERDAVAAVVAVIESMPEVLAEIDPNQQDLDLNDIIQRLPIFGDLNTLADVGTFSANDLRDISETMHQGALLALESGVILVSPDLSGGGTESDSATGAAAQTGESPDGPPTLARRAGAQDAVADDEHYERYLREREAMQQGGGVQQQPVANGNAAVDVQGARAALQDTVPDNLSRQDAVDELLQNLNRSSAD